MKMDGYSRSRIYYRSATCDRGFCFTRTSRRDVFFLFRGAARRCVFCVRASMLRLRRTWGISMVLLESSRGFTIQYGLLNALKALPDKKKTIFYNTSLGVSTIFFFNAPNRRIFFRFCVIRWRIFLLPLRGLHSVTTDEHLLAQLTNTDGICASSRYANI